jgi:hypothetical protein
MTVTLTVVMMTVTTVVTTVVTTMTDHYCPIANIKSGLPPGDNALQPDICAMKQEQLAK